MTFWKIHMPDFIVKFYKGKSIEKWEIKMYRTFH